MKLFGLTPEQVQQRTNPSNLAPIKPMALSMLFGALSLGIVSTLAYSLWAFRLVRGEALLFSAIAVVYLGLSGLALGRLSIIPGSLSRFMGLFAFSFLLYAIAWCAFWFGLGGQYHADLFGSAAGLLLMALIFHKAFGANAGLIASFSILFAFHTLGYYAGEICYAEVGRRAGRLLWGACHGFGFGAGLGALIHICQSQLLDKILKTNTEN
jgi:hypothetical protein